MYRRMTARGISSTFALTVVVCMTQLVWALPMAVASPVVPDLSQYEATYPALSVDEVIRQAVAGNVLAQHELSSRFAQGNGVPQNASAAAYWYGLATARGFPGTPSLDVLPNFPILAGSSSSSHIANQPTARFSITPDNTSLTATVDASASSAASSILRYVWSVTSASGDTSVASIGNVQSTHIALPEPGVYYITVALLDANGRIGHVTEKLDLSEPPEPQIPALPTITAPLASAEIDFNTSASFEWELQADANTYEFELFGDDSLSGNPIATASFPASTCIDDLCRVSVLFDFSTFGTLGWRARAMNEAGASDWVSSEIIALPPVPATPVHSSPAAGVDLNADSTVTFVWEEDPIADAYDFHIFNRSDSSVLFNLVSDLLPDDICVDALCSLDVTLDIPLNTGHAWRVRAKNSAGISSWSRTVFNIIEPITEPPETPLPLAPVAGGIVETGTDSTFSWQPAVRATAYEMEIISDTTLTASLSASSCSATVCSVTISLGLPIEEEFTWRVRSVNPIGESDWMNASFYTVEAAEDAPLTPANLSPDVGADVVANQIAIFSWVHDPQVSVYDFHFFNNEPGDERGELPFILDISPRDICANGVCEFSTLVNLPLYTQHAWRVRATNSKGRSNWSRSTFNAVEPITDPPLAPVAISPLSSALLETDTTVTFRWNTVATASRYQLQLLDSEDPSLDAPTAFIPAANCTADTCSISIALDLPIAQTYQWQVRAENAAGDSAWTTTDFEIIARATQQPPIPTPLSPDTDALISQNDTIDFTWTRDTHAVTYEFHFFDAVAVETLPFIVGLRPDDLCTAEQCVLSLPADLPVGQNHAWRVRGRNSPGASNWSRDTFEVIDAITDPPGVFELTSPAVNAEIQEGTEVTFRWTRAARATSFELALIDGTDPAAAIETVTINASSCSVDFCSYTTTPTLALSDQHAWQVRAINTLGETDWVSASFALIPEPVELADPPVIIAPLAGTPVQVSQTVAFQWQLDTNSLSYDFYLTDADEGAQPVVEGLLPAEHCADDVCSYSQAISLTPGDLHSWHVRARYSETDSEWSSTLLTVVSDAEKPVAAFSIQDFDGDAAGVAPLTLRFDPSASTDDGEIISFDWDFGDGSDVQSVTDAQIVEHTYLTPGVYTAQLIVTNDAALSNTSTLLITVLDPATTVSEIDASRLLTQATFGPTRDSIVEVQTLGIEAWLDAQFSMQGAPHLDYVLAHSNNSNRAPRHEIWWSDVVRGEDQLRQRVAFALSQLFVVSDTGYTLANSQYGITHYYDMLRENAFGNYRELLEKVTLSPVMGLYLSMLQNAKNDPVASTRADENYAREVLQLFSIGLHVLNIDGTTDGTPVFTQDQIEAFARVFTGWNYADAGQWNRPPFTGADLINPMLPFESFHDTDAKTLLNGATAPAGLSARQDLEFALDNIFNHPNVGPFIARQLIKRLVTSNPSPAYIQRIATVFNDDGSGERGNLQAVVRALLLDSEARSIPGFSAYGKLREPVLRLSHLWRAFNVQPGTQSSARQEFNTGSPEMLNLDDVTGQAVLKSPSVFNFFQPGFSPAGPVADQNLVAPEFELFTESNELATTNRIGRQIQEAYLGNPDSSGRRTSYLDFSYERSLAAEPEQLLDHLNILLLSGNLSADLRVILVNHLNGLPDTEPGLSQRVRDAVTLIMASPDYLVQM